MGQPAELLRMGDRVAWRPTLDGRDMRFGYVASVDHRSFIARDNSYSIHYKVVWDDGPHPAMAAEVTVGFLRRVGPLEEFTRQVARQS